MKFEVRDVPPRSAWALEQAGIHPLLARLYAARGVQAADELDPALARLLPPAGLKGTAQAATLLCQTDWPMEKVAARSGFASVDSLQRALRARLGTSSRAYRAR